MCGYGFSSALAGACCARAPEAGGHSPGLVRALAAALGPGRWTLSGALAGAGLGLLLDALHPGPITQIPALALLGWWWGRLGRQGPPIERSFSLGLLALLGAALLGGSLILQSRLLGPWPLEPAFHTWLAQTLLTALLAPLLCSLQLLLWRQQIQGGRG